MESLLPNICFEMFVAMQYASPHTHTVWWLSTKHMLQLWHRQLSLRSQESHRKQLVVRICYLNVLNLLN